MKDLASQGQALSETLAAAKQSGYAGRALRGMVPIFAVGMAHASRQLLLIAIDKEMSHEHRYDYQG